MFGLYDSNVFSIENHIEDISAFNRTFLLDRENKIVLTGEPFNKEKLAALYRKTIASIYSKDYMKIFFLISFTIILLSQESFAQQDNSPQLYFVAKSIGEEVTHRDMPIYTVTLDGRTLDFCDGCRYEKLLLLSCDDPSKKVYEERGDNEKHAVELPKELKGEFELQLYYKGYYLYTYITL